MILRKGQAFVPTMAKTEAGFYIGIEPVEVVDPRNRPGLEDALKRTISRGNPTMPTPPRSNFPESVLVKHAKAKSLFDFEKYATSWKLSMRDGAYFIVPYRPSGNSGNVEDTERGEAIPADKELDAVVRRLVDRALNSEGR